MPASHRTHGKRGDKSRFLVVHDYGMGGIWAYIWARSAEEILREFPELSIADAWYEGASDKAKEFTELERTYDLDKDKGLLGTLRRERSP